MAREYSSKRSSRRGTSLPQQVLVMVITFVLGYFTASIFDINALSHWMTTQILENHEPPPVVAKAKSAKEQTPPRQKFEFYTLLANEKGVGAASQAAEKTAQAPANSAAALVAQGAVGATNAPARGAAPVASSSTPTTRMAANQAPRIVPTQQLNRVPVASAKPVTPLPSQANYIVQVASFKARNDAEHMKGLLILKGFEVNVMPVTTPNQGNWFRVVIGPYPNRALAQKAQIILSKTERLNGMVRSAT